MTPEELDKWITDMRAAGWIICPPGNVPLPRSVTEAYAMEAAAVRYRKENGDDSQGDQAG